MADITIKDGNVKKGEASGFIGISNKFAVLNRLVTRDLNHNTNTPAFSLYSKDDITTYLSNPYTYEKQLRRAVTYIYGASTHFRRLIQYFVGLSDLAYIIEPYRIDPRKANIRIINNNYRKVLNMISSMNVKTQLPKILTVCLREDTFYGTLWVTNDSITIQQLPSDYCAISSIEGNVLNVTFDFSYFDSRPAMLESYPVEFRTKYEVYRNKRTQKWLELDSPTSFAIKCNTDILDYSVPPFVGILREIYDIEDLNVKTTNRSAHRKRYARTTPLIAGNPLEPYHQNGIANSYKRQWLENDRDWAISSQASNRGRFNDYPENGSRLQA